jgi:hypothetical protein
VALGQAQTFRQQEVARTRKVVAEIRLESVNRKFSEEFWDVIDGLLLR